MPNTNKIVESVVDHFSLFESTLKKWVFLNNLHVHSLKAECIKSLSQVEIIPKIYPELTLTSPSVYLDTEENEHILKPVTSLASRIDILNMCSKQTRTVVIDKLKVQNQSEYYRLVSKMLYSREKIEK